MSINQSINIRLINRET